MCGINFISTTYGKRVESGRLLWDGWERTKKKV
jgi:hypothetical protein